MTIAKRIRDCRYAKGWGPDELAHRAEISRTALYQIECGKTETPRAGTLRRIAQALEVSIDVLMGDSGKDAALTETDENSPRPGTPSNPGRARMKPPSLTPRGNIGVERELDRKFHDLLASPLGEGLARLVEESHRLLPNCPGDVR